MFKAIFKAHFQTIPMKKLLLPILVICGFLFGCANDLHYRVSDPNTCISTGGINEAPREGRCTTEQANANRAYLFNQCKDFGGTPVLKKVGNEGVLTVIIGIDCLMPDGSIKDLYSEKFEKDTGKKLFQ
jgi:hypothetical protein